MVKILEHIEASRENKGLTRAQMAEIMNNQDDTSGNWTKERLDKIFNNGNSCPRAETLAEMKRAVGIADFKPSYYRSKNTGQED